MRNIQLLSERDAMKLSGIGGEAGDVQVQDLIQGYIQEIEELRSVSTHVNEPVGWMDPAE